MLSLRGFYILPTSCIGHDQRAHTEEMMLFRPDAEVELVPQTGLKPHLGWFKLTHFPLLCHGVRGYMCTSANMPLVLSQSLQTKSLHLLPDSLGIFSWLKTKPSTVTWTWAFLRCPSSRSRCRLSFVPLRSLESSRRFQFLAFLLE